MAETSHYRRKKKLSKIPQTLDRGIIERKGGWAGDGVSAGMKSRPNGWEKQACVRKNNGRQP